MQNCSDSKCKILNVKRTENLLVICVVDKMYAISDLI